MSTDGWAQWERLAMSDSDHLWSMQSHAFITLTSTPIALHFTQIYKSIRWECLSYSTISISIMSQPPSSFHATQIPLNLPHVLSTTPFTKLPWPNAIDDWLAMNYLDSIHNFYSPGYMHLRDYLMIKWCVYFSYMLKQYISFLYHPPKTIFSINK